MNYLVSTLRAAARQFERGWKLHKLNKL